MARDLVSDRLYRRPFILTCEDDIALESHAVSMGLEFLTTHPDGLLSLYTAERYLSEHAAGIHQLRVKPLHGACAWLWPRDVLCRVLEHPLIEAWTGNTISNKPSPPETWDGVDTVVGLILNDLEIPTYFPFPSLCQHLGEVSSLPNKSWSAHRSVRIGAGISKVPETMLKGTENYADSGG
jgi:hypothetical protein